MNRAILLASTAISPELIPTLDHVLAFGGRLLSASAPFEYDRDARVLRFEAGYDSVTVTYLADKNGALIDEAFGLEPGVGRVRIGQALARPLAYQDLDARDRRRRGLRSDQIPRVICPA